jgi:hypothetical protein
MTAAGALQVAGHAADGRRCPIDPFVFGVDRRGRVETGYSITSSARARIKGGTVRPRALAVLRLTTSWKVVGSWTDFDGFSGVARVHDASRSG